MLLTQISEGRCCVETSYTRCVSEAGNPRALAFLKEVFELRPHFGMAWPGLHPRERPQAQGGVRPVGCRASFRSAGRACRGSKACQCGEVLKGAIKPWECKVFGTACTPETPIGTCMVSSEGACAAYYNFGRLHREVAVNMGGPR